MTTHSLKPAPEALTTLLAITVALVMVSQGYCAGPTGEEAKLMGEIAQCIMTKHVDMSTLATTLSAKTKETVLGDAADSAVDARFGHPDVVYQGAARDAAKLELLARLKFGTPDVRMQELLHQARGVDAYRIDTAGRQLPQEYTMQQAAAARELKRLADEAALASRQAEIAAKTAELRSRLKDSAMSKLAAGEALSPKQAKFIRDLRMQAVKRQLGMATGVSAGVSAIINVKVLLQGEVLTYLGIVGKDTGVAVLCQGVGVTLEEAGLSTLAPGASVVVFAVWDAIVASQTGDWSRFGLNFALNAGTTAAALGGAKAGASIGAWAGPWGAIGGGIVGGLVSAVGARWAMGKTPLGVMTSKEDREAVMKLAKELNPKLRELGLELDTTKSFKELTEQLKKGNLAFTTTAEFAAANRAGAPGVTSALEESGAMDSLLSLASAFSPAARVEGLKAIKSALGC
jgi:hypothetical protein